MGLSLTGCSDDDDLNTYQFTGDVSVESFGPCPVLRGGTLYFIGKNLEKITEVDLPSADPITQISVLKSGTESEITIQVPAEKCDTGRVVLKTATGQVITTVTPITYREDIVLDRFYVGSDTASTTGSVGDTVTFEGDYLNLFHAVIFTSNDTITEDQFLTHDRYTIQVAIPAEAKTGTVKLTNLAETPTEIETSEILTVNLPTISENAIDNTNPKAGETITISGEDLDQIAAVKFTGVSENDSDITVSSDGTELSVVVPVMATDGEVTLITKSGQQISAGSITTVVPTNLSASPNPVKNGNNLTISGEDLDLITGVSFTNDDTLRSLKSQTSSQIVVAVPTMAQDGDVTLHLANGKTVTVAITLVKPVVTSLTPSSVVAGNNLMMRGTDLDLVASVSFPGDATLTADASKTRITSTAIGVTVPDAAYGTGATLNLKNGTTVAVSGLTIVASTTPAINANGSGVIGQYTTVEGKNFNNVEAVYIGDTKVTKYSAKSNTSLTFQVPTTLTAGTYDFIMVSADGTSTTVGTFTAKNADVDIVTDLGVTNMDGSAVTYPYNFTWSDDGRFRLNKADLTAAGVTKGSKIRFYKTSGSTGQVQINNASWGSIYTVADWNGTEEYLEQEFDDAMMAAFDVSDGWSDTAFILQGDLKNVTKIVLIP